MKYFSKIKIIFIFLLILLILSTTLLFFACKKEDDKIIKISYTTSQGKTATINPCYIYSISKIFILHNGETLKDITSEYKSNKIKKTQVIFSEPKTNYEARDSTMPFKYNGLDWRLITGNLYPVAYSPEFNKYVTIKVTLQQESVIYIKTKTKGDLTTIYYPAINPAPGSTYDNDSYEINKITIPTNNILSIKYK